MSPSVFSSPKEKHVITKKLRVVLTRCPLPTGSSSINSQVVTCFWTAAVVHCDPGSASVFNRYFSSLFQKESQTEGGSDPVFDLSDISPTSSGSNTSQSNSTEQNQVSDDTFDLWPLDLIISHLFFFKSTASAAMYPIFGSASKR